jgi:hypothetical protein
VNLEIIIDSLVAPHPDDETLGCGGAIAMLRSLKCDVCVLVISNGTLSHPNSQKYPAPVLQALRESETLEALTMLGVNPNDVTFCGMQDGSISTQYNSAIASCSAYLTEIALHNCPQHLPMMVFLALDIAKTAISRAKAVYNQLDFEKIVCIGDGIWDVLTAVQLQLAFVGVASGEQKRTLQDAGVEQIIEDFANFDNFVEALNTASILKPETLLEVQKRSQNDYLISISTPKSTISPPAIHSLHLIIAPSIPVSTSKDISLFNFEI